MKEELYFSFDVEADGGVLFHNSILSIAFVAITLEKEVLGKFSVNLKPFPGETPDHATMRDFWSKFPEEYKETTKNPVEPKEAMQALYLWIEKVLHDWNLIKQKNYVPVPMAFPASYDFPAFKYVYERSMGKKNPFHIRCLDIKSLAIPLLKCNYTYSTKRNWPKDWFTQLPHTHLALDDALEQGVTSINILRQARGLRAIDSWVDLSEGYVEILS